MLLWLRIDRHCLKYKEKRKTNKKERGKQEAVRVGWKVICSQLSCTGGQVKREGESRGEKQDEMTKGKGASNMWLMGAPTQQFLLQSEHEYEAILTLVCNKYCGYQ